MNSSSALCLLLTCSLLLVACSTPTNDTARAQPVAAPAQPTPKPENQQNLRKGMTEAQIRAVWGAPKVVRAGWQAGETILIYHFDVLTTQRLVATSMKEVPAVDPITGEARTVMEPVLTPQDVTVTQTIVLQLKDGKLASWARQFGEQSSYK